MFVVGKKRSARGKRGQFTIFVIVGLVIFFVFAFALFARVKIITAQLAMQADRQIVNYIQQNSVDQYVTSCLSAVADEVMLKAAMQGGLLNTTGKTINKDYIQYNDSILYGDIVLNKTFNVSIAVVPNYNCSDGRRNSSYIVTQVPGLYPYNCEYTALDMLYDIYLTYPPEDRTPSPCYNNCTYNNFRDYSGFFGVNNLKILCDRYGANRPGRPSQDIFKTCYYYTSSNSLQKAIEDAIEVEVGRCINFTEIIERTPSNITVNGTANATLTFQKGGYTLNLQYPFTITIQGRQPVTRMIDFSIEREVPFKELYEYAYELANYDVTNTKFDAFFNKSHVRSRTGGTDTALYREGFDVNIIQGDHRNNYTNIIFVRDLNSEILGYPLTIAFAVKNRRPALDVITSGRSKLYDISGTENSTIIISPRGYDPDDEGIIYYDYTGWREDRIDYYNYADPNCSNPTSIDYVIANCTKQNITATAMNRLPYNWTRSPEYLQTRQNATYNASNVDAGLHIVRVTISDRQGLEDYQDIKVLIMDMPIPKIFGSNLYPSISDQYASYEDIYILNGSSSSAGRIAQSMGVTLSAFTWNDTSEPLNITKEVTQDIRTMALVVPEDISDISTINIRNIVDYTFRKKSAPSTMHNILFTVTTSDGLTNSNIFNLNVTQCLNHSSSVPIYPYDKLAPYNIAENDLMGHLLANHSCCNTDLTYKGTGSVCYSKTYYGLRQYLVDYTSTDLWPPVAPFTYTSTTNELLLDSPTVSSVDKITDNDIYTQAFERECSGTRGNVCNGDAVETRRLVQICNDSNGAQSNTRFRDERCVGPPSKFGPYFLNESGMYCVNYTYNSAWRNNTFEQMIGRTGADGSCTSSRQCSNGATFPTYATIPLGSLRYSCQGHCDGTGKCSAAGNCVCNSSCNSGTTGSPLCNGLPSGESSLISRCDAAGITEIRDLCVLSGASPCSVIEGYRCSSSAASGCNASIECNDLPVGSSPSIIRCVAGTNKIGTCDSNCRFIENTADPDNGWCRNHPSGYVGCVQMPSTHPCLNQRRAEYIGGDLQRYCDEDCNYGTCTDGLHRVDPATGTCYTYCTATGNECLNGPCVSGVCPS